MLVLAFVVSAKGVETRYERKIPDREPDTIASVVARIEPVARELHPGKVDRIQVQLLTKTLRGKIIESELIDEWCRTST